MPSGAKACQSCRSRQELSNEYIVFTCKIRLRYSRERASQSLPKISQKLEQITKTQPRTSSKASSWRGCRRARRCRRSSRSSRRWSGRGSSRRSRAPQAGGCTRPMLGQNGKFCKFLAGSFSAVSKRNFASKYALVTRCYAKQYEIVLRCMSPCSVCTGDFFQLEMLRISSQWKY